MGLYIRAGSADFATLRHDLALAPGLVVRRDVDGRPQCNFNSQDGVEGTAVFLPEGCGDEAACRGLRLEFSYGYSPLSPYVPLAECAVIERPELGPPSMGCSFRVDCTDAEAAGAGGEPLPVICEGGWTVVTNPPPDVRVTLAVNPPHPTVGDEVEIVISAPGAAYGFYTLSGLGLLDAPEYVSGNIQGQTSFRARAVRGGRVLLTANVNHEIQVGCSNYYWFQFVNASSETLVVDIAEPPGSVRLEIGNVFARASFPSGVPLMAAADVSLAATEASISVLRHRLAFAPGLPVSPRDDGSPDCSAIGEVDEARFIYLPDGCTPGADCSDVSVEIRRAGGLAASPQLAPLYRCNLAEIPAAAESCIYAIECADLEAADASGKSWTSTCVSGSVVFDIGGELPALPTSITIAPTELRVGEKTIVHVQSQPEVARPLRVSLDGLTLGLVRLLEGSDFAIVSDTMATFELQAVNPGVTTLSATASQVGGCGCLNHSYESPACALGVSERVAVSILPAPESTPTPVATATPVPPESCRGDCDGDAMVTVDELLTGVNVVLGVRPIDDCRALLPTKDAIVATVADVVKAINAALGGCR
jgi:hypothetical protein